MGGSRSSREKRKPTSETRFALLGDKRDGMVRHLAGPLTKPLVMLVAEWLCARKRGYAAHSKGFASSCAGPLVAKRLDCGVFRRFDLNFVNGAGHLTLVLFLLASCRMAQAEEVGSRYFSARPGALAEAKARLAGDDPSLRPALQNLVEQADDALQTAPPSVMQKSKMPPSGDKHDYLSTAPYWWPDPARLNGLPYIRQDGKVNPES